MTPHLAANTLAAVEAYPDTGDWHAEMRARLKHAAGGWQPNQIHRSVKISS